MREHQRRNVNNGCTRVSIFPISDGVTNALHLAINGLAARGKAISSNVANLETPGYHAAQVDFETSLRAALAHGDGGARGARLETSTSTAATRANGNNVNIDFELMADQETNLRQQLTVQALNAKYQLLRTAISGQ